MNDQEAMREALNEAAKAATLDEVPVGAIIVRHGLIIGRGHNLKETTHKIHAHAEIQAIEEATQTLGDWRLDDATLYVTLEPCTMCAGAIMHARIKHVVFGTRDPKGGALVSNLQLYSVPGFNHYPSFSEGVLQVECSQILKSYFQAKRKTTTEAK